ncbi:MAG: aroA [Solimicrobium sp.]|nr:aroA [Solimicrobium sp.]
MKTPHYPSFIELNPVTRMQGIIQLPGSKSISNRTLLLAALAQGDTEINGLLASDDTLIMLNALQALGVSWQQKGITQDYLVHGTAGKFPIKEADIFVGNAGTAIRPLVAALSLLGGDYTIHGVHRMHERPIGDLVDALQRMGAEVAYTGIAGFPPLHIKRGHIHSFAWQVRGDVSSQFLTALLMAAPLIARNQNITIDVVGELISKPYIEITLNLMQRFGVTVQRDGWKKFIIMAGQNYHSPGSIQVEGDASSASYFLAAGAICGGPVRVTGVRSNSIQGDIRFVDALEKMGASINMGDNFIEVRSNGALKAIDADFNAIPDAAMTIAIAALFADGRSVLRNIASWRVKETDRITAMAAELIKLGAQVETGDEYLAITPPARLKPASIATYDDHRMAMCFSLATLNGTLRAGTKIRILNPKCVAKTFPDFFDVFATIKQY